MYDRLRALIKGDAKGQERNNAMPVRKKFEFYERGTINQRILFVVPGLKRSKIETNHD